MSFTALHSFFHLKALPANTLFTYNYFQIPKTQDKKEGTTLIKMTLPLSSLIMGLDVIRG